MNQSRHLFKQIYKPIIRNMYHSPTISHIRYNSNNSKTTMYAKSKIVLGKYIGNIDIDMILAMSYLGMSCYLIYDAYKDNIKSKSCIKK